eukprot:TRINITY_DN9080_c0_g1_i3.p1 TRINITY_DN9080_c0_g1~~TRINITY_DN9080_c0_g1_i3.p1  ORF type:complete len:177 (-),score=27.03 TRINITY_DN9080_c0_g1_i3:132-662(-)
MQCGAEVRPRFEEGSALVVGAELRLRRPQASVAAALSTATREPAPATAEEEAAEDIKPHKTVSGCIKRETYLFFVLAAAANLSRRKDSLLVHCVQRRRKQTRRRVCLNRCPSGCSSSPSPSSSLRWHSPCICRAFGRRRTGSSRQTVYARSRSSANTVAEAGKTKSEIRLGLSPEA